MNELKDCIDFLETSYVGARAMNDTEAMDRLKYATYILEHGLDEFLRDINSQGLNQLP